MRFLAPWIGAGLVLAAAGSAHADIPAYYLGAGVRAGFNDSTAFVVDSKAKLLNLGEMSLSVRPELLFGNQTELRLPFSIEGQLDQGLYPYAGAGVAYNADGANRIDPLITAGIDIGLNRRLAIDLNANLIFKTGANSDTDTEFTATVNYVF